MYLRLSKKMLVEERIDFEVRITISTKMLPNTPTVRTMLTTMMCMMILMTKIEWRLGSRSELLMFTLSLSHLG